MFAYALRFIVLVLSLSFGASALADTVTLMQGLNGYSGTTDARIGMFNANMNFGGISTMFLAEETQHSFFVRFAIFAAEGGPVPDNAIVTSATLSLYKYGGPAATIKASRAKRAWTEMEVTWNVAAAGAPWQTAGALGGNDVEATADGQGSVGDAAADGCADASAPAVCWLNIDVTSGVQAFGSGAPNYGWKLAYVSGGVASAEKQFNARENGNSSLRPRLTVTYTVCAPGPFGGGAAPAPGQIEAENFDCGGEGVAYHDTTPGNQSTSSYRNPESVDVMDMSGGGRTVHFFNTGEWMNYTINVAASGNYDLAIYAASNQVPLGQTAGQYRIEIDGVDVTGNVAVPSTGNWDVYQWVTGRTHLFLAAGQHTLRLFSAQQAYRVDKLRITVSSGCAPGPFNGTPAQVPGTLEAENFDCGGEGGGYHDTTAGNQGSSTYRNPESVDVMDLSGGGRTVQYFNPGEWMSYTINVATSGSYTLGILAATNWAPAGQLAGQYRIEIDDVDYTGNVNVLGTGSWDAYQWVEAPASVFLSAGQHVLKLVSVQQAYRVEKLRVTSAGGCASGPFGGTPAQLPGTFEAENFDCGGEGVAYHDTTPGNQSTSTYRNPESVDVMDIPGGGRTVLWFNTGEWMQYTINIAAAGSYNVAIYAASNHVPLGQTAGQYRIEIDGVNVTGNVNVPSTGSWDTYQWVDAPASVSLSAGQHVLRIFSVQEAYRVDKLRVGAANTIDPTDILVWARADVPFAEQSGYMGQAIGTSISAPKIPETGIHHTQMSNGETLRLGKVTDPTNSSQKALAFQAALSDPPTSGQNTTRAELTGKNPNNVNVVVMNKVYWVALKVYVYDWGNLGTSDGSLFGTQMHQGNPNIVVGGPSFSLYARQSGRFFRVQARYSTSSTPNSDNSTSVYFDERPMPFGRWVDFVFKFKHNTTGSGFLQLWMDGQQIVSYTGHLGYNTGYNDYVKFGYYNWQGSGSAPRKLLLRSPVLVADPAAANTQPSSYETLSISKPSRFGGLLLRRRNLVPAVRALPSAAGPRRALARAPCRARPLAPVHPPARLRAEEPQAGVQARSLRAVRRDGRIGEARDFKQ